MENRELTRPDTGENTVESLSYEEAFQELERIVKKLEADQMTLEESINLYDRGQQLIGHCRNLLEKAELKISQIENEKLVPFETD